MEQNQEVELTPVTILLKAKELIKDQANWIQRDYARDSMGCCVYNGSPHAVKFCALGAIYKASPIPYGANFTVLVKASAARENAVKKIRECVGHDVAYFNDSHTHKEVIQAFDCAIEKATAQ